MELERPSSTQKERGSVVAIRDRIEQNILWANSAGSRLLALGLAHLALGRLSIYSGLLGLGLDTDAARNIGIAVVNLRGAGQIQELPRGLLTRAWLRFLDGARIGYDSAKADLDEAWEIAERGHMRLYLTDIHLVRARLFCRVKSYPWQSPAADLAAARKLIKQCGYLRRKKELEDAECKIANLKQ